MISNRLAAYLAMRRVHYGWAVLGATFLVMLATAGAMGASGVIIAPLEAEFGWSNADISSALAIRLALYGLIGPFAAALINRFGARAVVGVGGGADRDRRRRHGVDAPSLAARAVLGRDRRARLRHDGAGARRDGGDALVLGPPRPRRRPADRQQRHRSARLPAAAGRGFRALGLAGGAGLGRRHALVVALAFALALLRDRPADVGLPPFGEHAIVPAPKTNAGFASLASAPLVALREGAKSRVFWVLFATFFVCGLSTNGLIQTHWITLCGDFGVAPVGAAGILAVIGVFDFFGTILSGWLSDRYDNRWLLFWYYGLRGLSLIYLPFTDFSVVSLSLFAVFYGLDWVATVPPTVRLSGRAFGPETRERDLRLDLRRPPARRRHAPPSAPA